MSDGPSPPRKAFTAPSNEDATGSAPEALLDYASQLTDEISHITRPAAEDPPFVTPAALCSVTGPAR